MTPKEALVIAGISMVTAVGLELTQVVELLINSMLYVFGVTFKVATPLLLVNTVAMRAGMYTDQFDMPGSLFC